MESGNSICATNTSVPDIPDTLTGSAAMDDSDENELTDDELDATIKELVMALKNFKESTRQRTLGVIGDYLQRGSRYVEVWFSTSVCCK